MKFNLIKDEQTFIKLSKISFYSNLKDLYTNSICILEKFKEDYNDIYITLNNEKLNTSCIFLDKINAKYNDYLEKILLLSSKTIFTILLGLIKEEIYDNLHIVPVIANNNQFKINIVLNHIIKQIYITNKFLLVELDQYSNIINKQEIKIDLTIDLANSEDILIKIEKVK